MNYLTLIFLLLPIAAPTNSPPKQEGSGEQVPHVIPHTWDEEAIDTLELPNAVTGKPAKQVSAEFYYSVPARTIYRTHTIYAPGREPEGYLEKLMAAEPEVVMSSSDDAAEFADWTDEDWVKAGEEVFRTSLFTFPLPPERLGEFAARGEQVGSPIAGDGAFPYSRFVIREKGVLETGSLSCAECHTRVMPDGNLLIGAQGNEPFDRAFALSLRGYDSKEAAPRVTNLFGMPVKEGVEPTIPEGVDGETLANAHNAIPPGVVARHGTSSFSPVQIPDLIGVQDRFYLDRTGLQRHRNIGDMMRYVALNQGMDRLGSWDGYVPAAEELRAAHKAGFFDDATLAAQLDRVNDPKSYLRYSDPQLYALVKFLYALTPPPNPNLNDERALHGATIFEREDCGRCHPAPLYTSNQLVPAPGFRVPSELKASEEVRRKPVGTDPRLTMTTRRGTGFYKVPSLKGVWYRGPFTHDGSVATLEDWFDPRRVEDDYVPTGWNPGGEARAVQGHEFGLDLSKEDREGLIAFLRTL